LWHWGIRVLEDTVNEIKKGYQQATEFKQKPEGGPESCGRL
jgi:hypothetical protein